MSKVFDLSMLKPNPGFKHKRKRIGRGPGSGWGRRAGKGQKGQKARSGGGVRPGFEGGQMPLQRRLPKRGFINVFRREYAVVNLEDIVKHFPEGGEITVEALKAKGLVPRKAELVKILGNGNIDKAYAIKVHKVSGTVRDKIEKAGGSVELLEHATHSFSELTLGALSRMFPHKSRDSRMKVSLDDLKAKGLIAEGSEGVELIGVGTINGAYEVEVHKVSLKARRVIEAMGGKVRVIDPRFNYVEISFSDLAKWFPKGGEITPETLKKVGVVKDDTTSIRLVDTGRVVAPYTLRIHKISRAARRKLEAAGGKVELI